MTTGYNEELKRDIFRDVAAKQHLAMRMAHARRSFACDAEETETAADYCKRMLEKLGLKASKDPVADLSMFLAGHDSGTLSNVGGRSAMDSAGSSSFIARYIRGET